MNRVQVIFLGALNNRKGKKNECQSTFLVLNTVISRHPTSDIRHPTSDIRHPTSDIRLKTQLVLKFFHLNFFPNYLNLVAFEKGIEIADYLHLGGINSTTYRLD